MGSLFFRLKFLLEAGSRVLMGPRECGWGRGREQGVFLVGGRFLAGINETVGQGKGKEVGNRRWTEGSPWSGEVGPEEIACLLGRSVLGGPREWAELRVQVGPPFQIRV